MVCYKIYIVSIGKPYMATTAVLFFLKHLHFCIFIESKLYMNDKMEGLFQILQFLFGSTTTRQKLTQDSESLLCEMFFFFIYFSETAATSMHCSLNGPPENVQNYKMVLNKVYVFFMFFRNFRTATIARKILNDQMVKC